MDCVSAGSLRGARLRFNKIGRDGSGKANLTAAPNAGDVVHGAIYEVSEDQMRLLDPFESRGHGYERISIDVRLKAGKERRCEMYVAMRAFVDDRLRPFDWYKKLVCLGAEYHGFPADYLQGLHEQIALPDADASRAAAGAKFIASMRRGQE